MAKKSKDPKEQPTPEAIKIRLPFKVVLILVFASALAVALLYTAFLIYEGAVFWIAVTASALVFVQIVLSITAINHYLMRPLKTIYTAARDIQNENFDTKIELNTKTNLDAIGQVLNGANNKLKTIHQREENISSIKSEFLTVTAHQMRTPLSGIRWMFNALLDSSGAGSGLDDKQRKMLKQGSELVEDTINIINNLLNASLIEQGKFGYSFSKESIVDVVEDIVEEERRVSEQRKIQINFKKPLEEVPKVPVDVDKIKIVLLNLIDNSIKYSEPETTIDVWVENKDNEVWISVKDQGIGVPEDQKHKLFTKFFRAENAVHVNTTGNGLGLYIIRNIVTHHGGKVWFESKENEGATFTFSLPVHPEKTVEESGEGEMQSFLEDL